MGSSWGVRLMIRGELSKEVTFTLRRKGKEVANLAESVGITCAKAWRLEGSCCTETHESEPVWPTLGNGTGWGGRGCRVLILKALRAWKGFLDLFSKCIAKSLKHLKCGIIMVQLMSKQNFC